MTATDRIVHNWRVTAEETTQILAAMGADRPCDQKQCRAPHTVALCFLDPNTGKLTGIATCDEHHGGGLAYVEAILSGAGLLEVGEAN